MLPFRMLMFDGICPPTCRAQYPSGSPQLVALPAFANPAANG